MILYFSGTGNSRHVAETIAKATGDQLLSLNDQLRQKNKGALHSDKPYVIVAPTYAWRMPKVVSQWLSEAKLSGSKQLYFVLTCGSETHQAGKYAKQLAESKGLQYMGLASIVLPENYITMYEAPAEELAAAMIRQAQPHIQETAKLIQQGQRLETPPATAGGKVMSGLVNPLFYLTTVSAKGFYATEGCVRCGKCEQLCPLGNIELPDGRPVWGKDCTHCMACICGCPVEAIEYKNKTQGKTRYWFKAAE